MSRWYRQTDAFTEYAWPPWFAVLISVLFLIPISYQLIWVELSSSEFWFSVGIAVFLICYALLAIIPCRNHIEN